MRQQKKKNWFITPLMGLFAFFVSMAGQSVFALQGQSEQLDRLFTIQDIAVDITAQSASQAKEQAFVEAEKLAYKKLLQKLTQPDGRALLPELDVRDIQSMISGIEVTNEKTSARRYIAQITIRFEPTVFSDYLSRYNVGHVLTTGNGVLVLHTHNNGLMEELWEPQQSLKFARSSVDWLNRIRTYIFPKGLLTERKLVTSSEVAHLDAVGSQILLQNYGAESVLYIASKWIPFKDGTGRLTYKFYATGSGLSDSASLFASGKSGEQESLKLMYEAILEQLDSVWRKQLLVDTAAGGTLTAIVPVTQLETFIQIQKQLGTVSLVHNLLVDRLGIPESQVSFGYTGTKDQLTMALQFAGLKLEPWGNTNRITLAEVGRKIIPDN